MRFAAPLILMGVLVWSIENRGQAMPLTLNALPAQDAPPKQDPPAKPAPSKPAESVLVPFFGNAKCPIDDKEVLRDHWIEVEGQRVYACSNTCLDTLKLEPAKALAKAYPEAKPVGNKNCVACASAIVDEKKPVLVKFQGQELKLCSAACEKEFHKRPAVFLAKLQWPEAKDAQNEICPIDRKPVDGVTVVIYRSTLVRLSSPECVAEFQKDPDAALAKVVKTSG